MWQAVPGVLVMKVNKKTANVPALTETSETTNHSHARAVPDACKQEVRGVRSRKEKVLFISFP